MIILYVDCSLIVGVIVVLLLKGHEVLEKIILWITVGQKTHEQEGSTKDNGLQPDVEVLRNQTPGN